MSKKGIGIAVIIAAIVLVGLGISLKMRGPTPVTPPPEPVTPAPEEPKVIKIGAILPLTGDAAKYGEACKRGIDLAIEAINNAGGLRGQRIEIIYEDSQADPKVGVSAAQKLITVDKVPAIIGALTSTVTLAVAPTAERAGVVLLSPASSSPAISEAGDYIFRNCASDVFEASIMATFVAEELKINEVAILYINNDFGAGHRESFKKRFEELGGKIVTTETFGQGETDFRTQLTKIREARPDGIYLVGYKEMGWILRQARELGIETRFLSFSMFEDEEILELAGGAAEGVYYSLQTFDPESEAEVVRNFVQKYKEEYKTVPDIFAGSSYDATQILAFAIEKGGLSSEGIKEALYNIKDFPGVTGRTTFDEKGDVFKSTSIKMVKDGKFVWHKRTYPF